MKEAEEIEIDLGGFDERINRRASKALCCPECGSWIVGDDFEEGEGILTFPAGSGVRETRSFTVTILYDSLLEDEETVGIRAETPPLEGLFPFGSNVGLTVAAIQDDDLTFNGDTPAVDGNTFTISFNVDPTVVESALCGFGRQQPVDCKYPFMAVGSKASPY